MKKLYDEKFIEIIRGKIINGEFSTKEEIVDYLKKVSQSVINDPALIQKLRLEGIYLNSEELDNIGKDLLSFYDKNKSSLNLEGISQFEIDDKDYIKVRNEDGTYDVLDDSMSDKTFVEQMQERQNESVSMQTNDGVKNKKEIVEDMKKDKSEATLTTSTNISIRELTPEERRQFMAVMHLNDADKINFVVDTKRNIYINRDTGETYYVNKNQYNQMEVRKVEEVTSETIKENVPYIVQDGKRKEISFDSPNNLNFEELDQYDLEYIRDNRFDSLTPEQKEIVLMLIERRKEAVSNGEAKKQNTAGSKIYVKSMMVKPYNGFSSLIFLILSTLFCGTLFLIYMLFTINL